MPEQLDLEGRDEQRWFDLRGHGLHPSRPLLPHLGEPLPHLILLPLGRSGRYSSWLYVFERWFDLQGNKMFGL